MVAHTHNTGIQEQMTMKRRSCSRSSGPSSSGSDPSVSGPLAVVARKTPNSVRNSDEENDKNLGEETMNFGSSNKLSDSKGKLKMNKSHVRMSKTKNNLAAAEKEESKKRFRSQDKGKEVKSFGKKNRRDQDSPRVQRHEISQKESESRNKSLDNDEDIDFSVIEQRIFEGFQVGKSSGEGKSLRRNKTKKESVQKSLPLHSKDEKRRRTPSKEESALENKKFKESRKVKNINVSKRESKNVLTTSNCSKLKGATKGKTHIMVSNTKKKNKSDLIKESTGAASDSGMSDWEEVDEMEGVDEVKELLSESQAVKAKPEGVQIELDAPDVMWGVRRRKRRTEEEMIEDYLRKSVNKSIKEVYENMHKVHLLCLFAHGRYVNQTMNSDILLGAALSIITDKNAYPPKRLDMNYLEKFTNWFSRKITLKPENMEDDYWSLPLETLLCKRFEIKKAHSNREFVYMFIVICRALGMKVRLVLSLQPMSWKPSAEILIRPSKKEEKNKGPVSEASCSQNSERCEKKLMAKISKGKKNCNNRKMLSSESDEEVEKKKGSVTKKSKKIEGTVKKRKSLSDDEWDSDFEPNPVKIQRSRKSTGKMQRSSSNRKSTEENNAGKRRKIEKDGELESKRRKAEPLLEWAEVYVEEEERWICIDVARGKIHCIPEIEVRIPAASAYITAFSANLTIKDVTRRYISSWLSSENKMRCCSKWWKKALKPFEGRKTRLDREEEEEMDQNLRQQPLPKTIAEYKNHPLYALQRHLLKFEAIYPPDVSPAGFFKKEPVYPRDSVFTLCSRDTWMKEAKTVKIDEEPYKIVKARPKWDRNICKVIKDRPLELFGEWQVEDYIPPVASGGKVPRNEYGNVELFKPSMLPGGCVHIPIAGLNRIARKLNIDCAPAMVGFDFHSGWTHPVYDGYVVCEEFKDTLLDAWNQEQTEQAKRAEEKREKRIYGNWKKLIQGILVKERVRKKYGDVSMSDEEEEWKKDEKKEVTKRKIKQEDIDAVRPTLVTHEVKNLQIDLSSNVVEMAEKSRKRTMKTKNVKRSIKKENPKRPINAKTDLGDSESASDEEEKKEKIRAILQWGDRTVASNPDLSDDSDVEKVSHPSTSAHTDQLSNPFYNSIIKPSLKKYKNVKSESRKRRKETCGQTFSGSERSVTSASTSRSTTPEPDLESTSELKPRRTSLRNVKRKIKTYKENEEHSEGDISIDESDYEDRSYDPKKEISHKEASKLSDLSDLE